MKNKTRAIILGVLTGLSTLFTLVTLITLLANPEVRFASYPFYQRVSLYLDQAQEQVVSAIFRIGGPLLLGGLVAYWLVWLIFFLPIGGMVKAVKKRSKKKARKKFLDKKSFKAPGASMFIKWAALLLYLACVFLLGGYFLNGIAIPRDFWIRYVIFYMYGILGGVLLNHCFNLLSPCKSNRYLEFGFFLLLAGGGVAAFFFLDKLGISLTFYIHSCILLGAIALINATDFTSAHFFRCPECGGRCKATLIDKDEEDLGSTFGYVDVYEKVGSRETTVTISDDHGNTVAEGSGSEDIYEKHSELRETHHWKTIYTYDCECIYCHAHHKNTDSVYHSS